MAQKDWPRWIVASIGDYLKTALTNVEWPSLVDGVEERTDAFIHATNRAEVRVTGPFIKNLSAGYFQAFVDVNVLLSSRYDGPAKNAYDLLSCAGVLNEAMDQEIAVWNFGNQPGDFVQGQPETQVCLGCLVPRFGQSLRVLNFGQIDVVDRLKQTEVEARYMIELYE
jgi:hypothetical protein